MGAVLGEGTILHGGENRVFAGALLGSLLLHALLLFGLPGLREGRQYPSLAPGPIVARLVSPSVAAAPPPSPVEERPPQKPAAQTPPAAKPTASPPAGPSPAAKAAPEAKPPAPASPDEALAQGGAPPVPAASAAAAPGPIARAEPSPSAPATAPPAEEPGTLAQYRLALISTARKYKHYPRVAVDNNWEGTSEIEMAIGSNGSIASLRVRASAGHEVLDRQALEMFEKAKPLVPIPPALRGKEFTVVLRAIYSLKDRD